MDTGKNHYNRNIINEYRLLICLFLTITILAAYWQVRTHEFVNFDDELYVVDNDHVKNGLNLKGVIWAFGFTGDTYWHPLTWLSHMMDCQLYGLNPGMHHTTNLILHILNSLLLFLVFKQMTGALWRSAFVAALFALHPINAESVAWVAERKNVLSTFFWMLTMLTYVHYFRRKGLWRYLLILFVFFLGLMCKPMLITLPFVLILLDYWPLQRFAFANLWESRTVFRLVIEKVPLVVLSILSFLVSTLSLQNSKITVSVEFIPFMLRIANALISYVKYLGKIIWPQNLIFFYPYPKMIPNWHVLFAGLFLVCITIIVIRAVNKRPYLGVGWFWYIITLIPVSGLIQAGLWPAMADRWAYVPLIGIFVIIAWGISDLLKKWRFKKNMTAIAGIAYILILSFLTWLQVGYWQNSFTLNKHALGIDQSNAVAHLNLGTALAKDNRPNEAISHFLSTLKIYPDHKKAFYNIGLAMLTNGNYEEAIYYFLKYLKLCPDDAKGYQRIGLVYSYKGKINDSKKYYYKALDIDPEFEEAHFGLGVIFASQKKYEDAIKHYSETLRIKPDFITAHINIGNLFLKNGQLKKAISHYSEALKIEPDTVEAHNGLGAVMVHAGRIEKAIDHFKRALLLKPDDKVAQKNLNNLIAAMEKHKEDFRIIKK